MSDEVANSVDVGNKAAQRIEQIHLDSGSANAGAALQKDFDLSINNPSLKTAYDSEVERLKKDDPANHLLSQLSLDWAGQRTTEHHKIKYDALTEMSDHTFQAPILHYDQLMVDSLKSQYGDLTTLWSPSHDLHLLPPKDWGFGIMHSDLDRVGSELETDRAVRRYALQANEMLLGDNSKLFKDIAGSSNSIGFTDLSTAIKSGKLTGEQQTFAIWMFEHWTNDEVKQLKGVAPGQRGRLTEDSIHAAGVKAGVLERLSPDQMEKSPLEIALAAKAAAEKQAADKAEAARIAAEKEAADKAEAARIAAEKEAAEKAAETARIAAEKEAAEKAAETARIAAEKEAAEKAAETARIAAEKEAAEKAAETARIAAEKETAEKAAETARIAAEKEAAEKAAETARIAAEKETAEKAAETARIAAEKETAEKAAETARIAAEKETAEKAAETTRIAAEKEATERAAETARIAAEKEAADKAAEAAKTQKPADAGAPDPAKTVPDKGHVVASDHVKVSKGMGYWDAAAMMLGYTDEGSSLKSTRHHINKDLSGLDRTKIYQVMDQLRKSNHDDFRSSKLRPGDVLHKPD